MKGPGLRIDNDVRRTWQCPVCGKTARAEGDFVGLRCSCKPDGTSMRLVEGIRRVRQFPRPAPSADAPRDEPIAAEPASEPGVFTVLEVEASGVEVHEEFAAGIEPPPAKPAPTPPPGEETSPPAPDHG